MCILYFNIGKSSTSFRDFSSQGTASGKDLIQSVDGIETATISISVDIYHRGNEISIKYSENHKFRAI